MHALLLFLFAASHLCAAFPEQGILVAGSSPPPGGCLLPDTPRNGEYTAPLCKPGDTYSGCDNVPGTPVVPGWTIKYRCSKGYGVSSENSYIFSVCDNGVWNVPIDCVRMCPKLISSTVDITCKYKDREVDCNKSLKQNTTAHVKCKRNYKASRQLGYYIMSCESRGWWSQPLPECFSDCGIPNNGIDPLIVNEPMTPKGDYPWMATIYRQNQSLRWDYFCSGTLISPHIVLTAAHCVTTPEAQVIDHSYMRVGLGKYFWDFYKKENNSIIAEVKMIIIPSRYSGAASVFSHDIALVDLSVNVPTNNYIMPACVDWQKQLVFKPENTFSEGYVSGWDRTQTEHGSTGVRATTLQYFNQTECMRKVRSVYQRYIHADKFCTVVAGNGTGDTINSWNSGRGMTVVKEGIHYVVGVSSVRINSNQPFTIFTGLEDHLVWLETEKIMLEMLHRTELENGGN